MKDLEFLAIGLRLVGISCIIFAIGKTGESINAIYQFNAVDMGLNPVVYKVSVWLPVLLIYAVGMLFVTFPILCAKGLLPKSSSQSENIEFSQNAITISGLTLLGIYLLIIALPDLAFNILLLYQQSSFGPVDSYQVSQISIHLVFTVIQLILGVYLVLGANGLYKLIRKFRG